MRSPFVPSFITLATVLCILLLPALALAAGPGSAPMAGFLQGILDWLCGTIGPLVFGLGLAIALFSMMFGMPGGFMRALMVAIAGAGLFSIGKIISFVSQISQ